MSWIFATTIAEVNDSERTMLALRATEGKRLTLPDPNRASA